MGGSAMHTNMLGMIMHRASESHGGATMYPEWLGIAGVTVFALIALSHTRRLRTVGDGRAAWHACHLLMAVGMVFMYAPPALHVPSVSMLDWRLVFATAAVLAALCASGGGRRVPHLTWLLAALDLCVMAYMWSPGSTAAAVTWVLVAYLTAKAGIWTLGACRRIGGDVSSISLADVGPEPRAVAPAVIARPSGLRNLDVSAAKLGMTLGMGYMVIAMQLAS